MSGKCNFSPHAPAAAGGDALGVVDRTIISGHRRLGLKSDHNSTLVPQSPTVVSSLSYSGLVERGHDLVDARLDGVTFVHAATACDSDASSLWRCVYTNTNAARDD